MSNERTKRMLKAYFQRATITQFFSSQFASPPRNFHSGESVEMDIVRSEEDVAIVITDLSTGYRFNAADLYTNKEFIPPIYKEAVPLNAHDLLKRVPGQNPFATPNFRGNLILKVFDAMDKVSAKIKRAIELQASQIMQTGTVTLIDSDGNAVFTVDFFPKSTHFPTAGTTWASETGLGKIDDLDGLATVVRTDGLMDPDTLVFGKAAYRNFFEDPEVRVLFDTRRIDMGTLGRMQIKGGGGRYRGIVEFGNYRYDVWTYDGRYKHPSSGTSTAFMDPGKVIVMASDGRKDATFGAIPNIARELGINRAGNLSIPNLPGRFPNTRGGLDLWTNVWVSEDGEQLFAGVGSRPLLMPTAIDTYGCLDTQL